MKEKANKVRDLSVSAKYAGVASEENTMTAPLEGINITRGEVCYKSKLLNKIFDNYDELVKAEEEYEKANAEKLKQAEEKKSRLLKIREARAKTFEARKQASKLIAEADDAYAKLVNEFIKDYGYYHDTYEQEIDGTWLKQVFNIFNW